jgi:hypothetical protein
MAKMSLLLAPSDAMKRFTDAGRQALADKNNYAALSLALMIPDICGSMEDPGPNRTQRRYKKWFKQWAEPKFGNLLSAEECYRLRNSMIHSGSAESMFVFLVGPKASHLMRQEFNVINGVPAPKRLVLEVSRFCETIYQAADEWDRDSAVNLNPVVRKEKAKLLVIRSRR